MKTAKLTKLDSCSKTGLKKSRPESSGDKASKGMVESVNEEETKDEDLDDEESEIELLCNVCFTPGVANDWCSNCNEMGQHTLHSEQEYADGEDEEESEEETDDEVEIEHPCTVCGQPGPAGDWCDNCKLGMFAIMSEGE